MTLENERDHGAPEVTLSRRLIAVAAQAATCSDLSG
jgi:hypothetical protein